MVRKAGDGMEIEWEPSGETSEMACIPLPDNSELRLVNCPSTGKYRVFDLDSGFSIPEDTGVTGRKGALESAAVICRERMQVWEHLADELDRASKVAA